MFTLVMSKFFKLLVVKFKNHIEENFFINVKADALASVNPKQPKVLGLKFSLGDIGRIFAIKICNFKLWKMPKLLNFRFPDGWYSLNCDNTDLKRSSKIFLFCFRTASLGR